MAWSPHDGDLLLSSGKDNRTLVWDAKDGSVLAEFPASSNWNFDAQWSKKTAGEISALHRVVGHLVQRGLARVFHPEDAQLAREAGDLAVLLALALLEVAVPRRHVLQLGVRLAQQLLAFPGTEII